MKKIDSVGSAGFPLSRRWLVGVRARALRRGVWYSVLSRGERGFVDLAIRVVERVSSRFLGRVLSAVVGKLVEVLDGSVGCLMGDVGGGLALRLSRIAVGWGNRRAAGWAGDVGFVRYLTVMAVNSGGSGVGLGVGQG